MHLDRHMNATAMRLLLWIKNTAGSTRGWKLMLPITNMLCINHEMQLKWLAEGTSNARIKILHSNHSLQSQEYPTHWSLQTKFVLGQGPSGCSGEISHWFLSQIEICEREDEKRAKLRSNDLIEDKNVANGKFQFFSLNWRTSRVIANYRIPEIKTLGTRSKRVKHEFRFSSDFVGQSSSIVFEFIRSKLY